MRILHYALGFPPYRSGGLTTFCIDLMVQQVNDKHEVALLWPGKITMGGTTVKDRGYEKNIRSFELLNPLPISYDEGIIEISHFKKDILEKTYEHFLRTFNPNVIHIHTLMGLHKAFLTCARRLQIRIVFTAHDFFPICPKVKLIKKGEVCTTAESCIDCPQCNLSALKLWKLILLQSSPYRFLKNSYIIKTLRIRHRNQYFRNTKQSQIEEILLKTKPEDYIDLRMYFFEILSMIDCIHYNSSVTKRTYERFFHPVDSCLVPITHMNITDHRKKKIFSLPLKFTYLGPQDEAKGYFLLKKVLDKLWMTKKNFLLNVFFTPNETPMYIKVHEKYSYSDLSHIFDQTDLLIAPSIWYETFGYTVLEALSYGVPVLISGTVGAKDILVEGAGIVIEQLNEVNLEGVLDQLTVDQLSEMNAMICYKQNIPVISEMADRLNKELYGFK